MADPNFPIGQRVLIDGSGRAEVLQRVCRGFGTFYMVQLDGTDAEFELEHDRLTAISEPDPPSVTVPQQTTGTSRFVPTNDINITEFIDGQSNRNTLSKTFYDLKILREFMHLPEINETREIQDIPINELSHLLSRFFISVRRADGSEYEPSSLRVMLSSFDRQLRRHNYGDYLATSPKFAQVREVLKSKQKFLKRSGKGNLSNKADPINDEELDILWDNKQFGSETPDAILQTLWFYTTVHFGLRGRAEHRSMCWDDVEL